MKIAVAGTGYVGLSMAVLLAQNHEVTAVDVIPEKVELLQKGRSPIRDKEIKEYLAGGRAAFAGYPGRRGGLPGCGACDRLHTDEL